MKFAYFKNKLRAKPKILPALGGIKKIILDILLKLDVVCLLL